MRSKSDHVARTRASNAGQTQLTRATPAVRVRRVHTSDPSQQSIERPSPDTVVPPDTFVTPFLRGNAVERPLALGAWRGGSRPHLLGLGLGVSVSVSVSVSVRVRLGSGLA